jgi:hypothetical protein
MYLVRQTLQRGSRPPRQKNAIGRVRLQPRHRFVARGIDGIAAAPPPIVVAALIAALPRPVGRVIPVRSTCRDRVLVSRARRMTRSR